MAASSRYMAHAHLPPSSASSSSSSAPLPTVVAFSFDMDGSLINLQYVEAVKTALDELRLKLRKNKNNLLSPRKALHASKTLEALEKLDKVLFAHDYDFRNLSPGKNYEAHSDEVKTLLAKGMSRLPYNKNYEAIPEKIKKILTRSMKIALEKANIDLIDHIIANIPENATVYLLSGSNRQTRVRDYMNGNPHGNGCSAIALQQLAVIIQERLRLHNKNATVYLDGILLEDLVTNQTPGTHFNSMLKRGPAPRFKGEDINAVDKDTEFDENKRMLLYIQMQHIALKHPKLPVAFHFYDDDPYTETKKQILSAIQLYLNNQVPEALLTFIEKQIPDALLPYVNELTRKSLEQIQIAIHAFQPNKPGAINAIYEALRTLQQVQPNVIEQLHVFLETFNRKQQVVAVPEDATTIAAEGEQIDVCKQICSVLEASQGIKSDAIPKKVTLYLHEYAGADQAIVSTNVTLASTILVPKTGFTFPKPATFKHMTPIQGAGKIDPHYEVNYRKASMALVRDDFIDCRDLKKKESLFQAQMNPWIQKVNDASQIDMAQHSVAVSTVPASHFHTAGAVSHKIETSASPHATPK